MSDLISRWDVIKAVLGSNFSACTVYGRSEEGMATARELIQAIKKLPSVQPEIIRCKDCKHYREYVGFIDGCCHMAEWYKRYQYPDDYCSRAERRSDDV